MEYNTDVQLLFLRMMLSNPELYTRVMNIINPLNFDKSIREIITFMLDHTNKYNVMPEPNQIQATTGYNLEIIPDMNDGHSSWFTDEFEKFTKRQELERAIMKSYDLLEKGEFDPVEKIIKDAVQISLMRDLGTDYFSAPAQRLEKYFTAGGQVSTGWPQLDALTYGGFSVGELIVWAGSSGSGKSLVMMNLALNWLQQGKSGIYITLELAEELTSLRTDAMLTGMSTREIRKNIEETEMRVKMTGKKFGQYRIKYLPAQSNTNTIKAYVKEVQLQTGMPVDFVCVDYLDLVTPVSAKIDMNNVFLKDKFVSEELRNMSQELGVVLITASQLNRSSIDEIEFDHSMISGGISKINSSDFVFGIFTSRSMRERGKYQIQCMKARNSTGVGHKIDLDYNVDTMRITDSGGDDSQQSKPTPSQIMSNLKNRTGVSSADEPDEEEDSPVKKVTASVQGSKLNDMLRNLKQSQ